MARCKLVGCDQTVDFIPTGRPKRDGSGREAVQIVDSPPEKRIVMQLVELDIDHDCDLEKCVGVDGGGWIHQGMRGRIVDSWIDHHGTCKPFLRSQEEARAARRRDQPVTRQ